MWHSLLSPLHDYQTHKMAQYSDFPQNSNT